MVRIVVLFGGGDGGGLIITENGVRSIPPFDPAILLNLRATNAMVRAISAARADHVRIRISKAAVSLCTLAVEQVEEAVGPLEGETALVYQDETGAFSCGSTGKPPIPIPWPPQTPPSVQDYLTAGVVEPDLVTLVRAAREKKIPLTRVFEVPQDVAEQLGLPLSQKSANDLRALAPDRQVAIKDPVEREVVTFFYKVAEDGHHLDNWFARPYEVAKELNFKLSDAAAELILTGSQITVGGGLVALSDAAVIAAGVVWAGVCIVVGTATHQYGDYARPIGTFVTDHSQAVKI
jgi:hypothetical protein